MNLVMTKFILQIQQALKARRSKTMNRKFKYDSARLQMLMQIQSTQETITNQRTIGRFKNLSRKFRKMISLNVNEIEPKMPRPNT